MAKTTAQNNGQIHDDSQPATRGDLKNLRSYIDDKFATKKDLKNALKNYPTKKYLRRETNNILSYLDERYDHLEKKLEKCATKKDLREFATKAYFDEKFSHWGTSILNAVNGMHTKIGDLDKRVRILEAKC